MNVIFVGRNPGAVKQLDLHHPALIAGALGALVLILGAAFTVGLAFGHRTAPTLPTLSAWSHEFSNERVQIDDTRRALQEKINAIAMRVGQMNASVIRLDALGKRLTQMAGLDNGEFDFGNPPPQGGAEAGLDGQPAQIPNLTGMIDDLQSQLSSREQQLGVLENLILTRDLNKQVFPQGRPVGQGYISSYFGNRADPFTGFTAYHRGLDFAAPEGTRVTAVGAGLVVWAGNRAGFGELVEINHGNGLSTRYGHNEKLLVKAGDIVHKGDAIALMGSTGRSTGTHLHFEVLKNGAQVDPLKYIGTIH